VALDLILTGPAWMLQLLVRLGSPTAVHYDTLDSMRHLYWVRLIIQTSTLFGIIIVIFSLVIILVNLFVLIFTWWAGHISIIVLVFFQEHWLHFVPCVLEMVLTNFARVASVLIQIALIIWWLVIDVILVFLLLILAILLALHELQVRDGRLFFGGCVVWAWSIIHCDLLIDLLFSDWSPLL
jgi:hypothetical protein